MIRILLSLWLLLCAHALGDDLTLPTKENLASRITVTRTWEDGRSELLNLHYSKDGSLPILVYGTFGADKKQTSYGAKRVGEDDRLTIEKLLSEVFNTAGVSVAEIKDMKETPKAGCNITIYQMGIGSWTNRFPKTREAAWSKSDELFTSVSKIAGQ